MKYNTIQYNTTVLHIHDILRELCIKWIQYIFHNLSAEGLLIQTNCGW